MCTQGYQLNLPDKDRTAAYCNCDENEGIYLTQYCVENLTPGIDNSMVFFTAFFEEKSHIKALTLSCFGRLLFRDRGIG